MAPGPLPFQAPEPHRETLTVFVRGLEVQAGIGVHDHEQGRLQTLVIDVSLELGAGDVDGLSDTVNYETVAEAARAIVAAGHVGLVETFADRLALACLDDPRVRAARVRVEKPGALAGTIAPGCEVVWRR
ncbi:dihydroneopterin aldolase [Brevundimonas sp.]|uniref:dihydroneopterin aldolase n=1 Tax=Brevundimonas sp. TaxID=1871086 RepID=UPI0025C330DC|nr:dihydroneopterin aldolase [Brevundimonas sp.]